jgi:hypothetical protein
MGERNVIGAVGTAILSPFVDGWGQLLPFVALAVVLLVVDLRFGIKASVSRGEKVRKSRAIRRTMNKLVDYLCWLSIAWLFGCSFGEVFDFPLLTYIVLAIIYGVEFQSIIDNYIEYKHIGKHFSLSRFVSSLFRKSEVVKAAQEATTDKEANNGKV